MCAPRIPLNRPLAFFLKIPSARARSVLAYLAEVERDDLTALFFIRAFAQRASTNTRRKKRAVIGAYRKVSQFALKIARDFSLVKMTCARSRTAWWRLGCVDENGVENEGAGISQRGSSLGEDRATKGGGKKSAH